MNSRTGLISVHLILSFSNAPNLKIRPHQSPVSDSPLARIASATAADMPTVFAATAPVSILSELIELEVGMPEAVESEITGFYLELLFDPAFKLEFGLVFMRYYRQLQLALPTRAGCADSLLIETPLLLSVLVC